MILFRIPSIKKLTPIAMSKQSISWQEQLAMLSGNLPAADETLTDNIEPEIPEKGIAQKCGKISVFYEKKGRGGKQATIITGFENLSELELTELASEMKKKLATGGSARNGEILIQGDRRNDVTSFLKAKGFKGIK